MTDAQKIKLHGWWMEELRAITRKVMAQETKRQEKEKAKVMRMFGDLAIERREDIDELYSYGAISSRKRDRLMDLWEQGESIDWMYQAKIDLLQDAYMDAQRTIKDLQEA